MGQVWWVIYPYLALAVMVVGTIYRYMYNPLGWGSKSSELLEKRWLRLGSLLFHWGILFVAGGHVIGLLIPKQVHQWLGVSDELYHLSADVLGGLAGFAAWLGVVILLLRRIFNRRVRLNSTPSDYVVLVLLFVVITLGDVVTMGHNNIYGPYEYRDTVGPWVRGLLTLHPDVGLMAQVPLLLQIHVIAAFALFAVSPFSRLVHAWSAPITYPMRAPIQYRSRTRYLDRQEEKSGTPANAGMTEGNRMRSSRQY